MHASGCGLSPRYVAGETSLVHLLGEKLDVLIYVEGAKQLPYKLCSAVILMHIAV